MAQNNQPFKRPNITENEEYKKIPPPTGQESKFVPPGASTQPNDSPGNMVPQQVVFNPPSQEEINWAIQLEENVKRNGYKPNDAEMAKYQEIANKIVMFQQAQMQAQASFQQQQPVPVQTVAPPKKKSKLGLVIKLFILLFFSILFIAKVSIIVLQPSYFVPRGKIYFVIKPENFSTVYYSINMDKIYEEKLKKGFTKEELNPENERAKSNNKKGKTKINPKWYIEPEYWEKNYILSIPYIKI